MTYDADYADRSYNAERRAEAEAAARHAAAAHAALPLAERCRPVQMVPRREFSTWRVTHETALAAARAAGDQQQIDYRLNCLMNLRSYQPQEYYPRIVWPGGICTGLDRSEDAT